MKLLLTALAELHKETEVNFEISSFWDMGYTVKIGDSINGYESSQDFEFLDGAVSWLVQELQRRTGRQEST